MATETGLFTSATWQATGGGTLVTVNKNLLSFPDIAQNAETLAIATGLNRRLRSRHDITLRVHDISTFAALKALMISRTELEFSLLGSNTHQWDPMRFSVVYALDQVPNIKKVWIGADGATSDPVTTPANWTSLGAIEAGDAPSLAVVGPNDGVALPLYTATTLEWTLRLIDDATAAAPVQTTLASFQGGLARIALESPDGSFTFLGGASAGQGVNVDWDAAPEAGVESFFSGVNMTLTGSQEDPDNLIVLPGTPSDFVFAFDLVMAAVSTNFTDFYSVS